MKIAALILLLVGIAIVGSEIYGYTLEEKKLEGSFSDLQTRLGAANADRDKFRAELEYFQNPVNLEKELRARFNYKNPDEKLIIIVPNQASTTASPTPN